MKKLLILLFIFSVGCFGQLTRKPVSSGSGIVGLKDTTDGVKSNGISTFYFGNNFTVSDNPFTPFLVTSTDGYTEAQMSSKNTPSEFSLITHLDESVTELLSGSPFFNFRVYWGESTINYIHYIDNDTSYFLGNTDSYGLKIRPTGQLQSVTENGTENVLTNFGTLSGTIYVKDTNDAVKSLTFTNGLLTASDFEEFAGVFKVNDSNLTQSNFKQSPDYAEFLEFQKYLYMKKSLAQKE